jgi:hypothetical protein
VPAIRVPLAGVDLASCKKPRSNIVGLPTSEHSGCLARIGGPMRIRLLASMFVVSLAFVGAKPAFATPVSAVKFTGFGITGPVFGSTVGWEFTVHEAFLVTSLGWWDLGSDGLDVSHQVVLWTSGGSRLTSTIVPSGVGATLVDGFRYAAITPFLLTPGAYIIGGLPGGLDIHVGLATGFAVDPRLTFVTGRFATLEAPGGAFPVHTDPNNPGIFGPGMQIEVIPEPASVLLLGAGLTALGFRRPMNRRIGT